MRIDVLAPAFGVGLVATSLLAGCGGGGGGGTPASTTPSSPAVNTPQQSANPQQLVTKFVDATAASGINYAVAFLPMKLNSVMKDITYGGAAAGDYDGDGDIDVFVVRGDAGPNLLYENRFVPDGSLAFVDVAADAGLAYTRSPTENWAHSTPAFADMDGDGDLDLFIGGLDSDPSLIFENLGDRTFADVTQGSGIDGLLAEQNISAAFGDYDLDGDVDLFVSHWGTRRPKSDPGDTEHLWRNITDPGGPIRFTSVSVQAGISPSVMRDYDPAVGGTDWTLTPNFARIDDDLYPDILSVADYGTTQVFMNNGNGTFRNVTNADITDDNGMGSAVGDFDDDGDLDWFVSSILQQPPQLNGPAPPGVPPSGNRLYRNNGGKFADVTQAAGVRDGGWGWGSCMFDFENDGDLDIYHTNGWSYVEARGDFRFDSSRAFVSDGAGHFENRAAALGLADTMDARGAVCADFDNDGDVDILQLHDASGLSATLWKNNSSGNNYLRVKLVGLPPNTEAAGARITAKIGSVTRMREIMIANNYISQSPTIQIFGLGSAARVDVLTIEWPDAASAKTVMTDVPASPAHQTLIVRHPGL